MKTLLPILLFFFVLASNAQECLIAHYPFSGDALDVMPNSYDGIVFGATLTNDMNGAPNSAYYFNGSTAYIQLNNNVTIIPTTNFSIAAWARMDGQGGGIEGNNQIYVQRNNSTPTTSAIGFKSENANGNIEFAVRTVGNYVEYIEYPAPSYGGWNHYVAVCNADSMKIFLNGAMVVGDDFTQSGGNVTAIDFVEIGRQYFNSAVQGAFYGAIDDVRLYDCPLTDAEVANLFTTTYIPILNKHNGYSIFPNPTSDIINIAGPAAEEVTLKLVDMLGSEVSYTYVNEHAIDISLLDNGVYFLSVYDDKGNVQTVERIIKK
ncbi:MAG: hypothetical protein C0592_12050 [Marinilabiliales bacterium]|nr:MAG: hypothetical protein C0592_12050 [Marinilabiliales bacterium]